MRTSPYLNLDIAVRRISALACRMDHPLVPLSEDLLELASALAGHFSLPGKNRHATDHPLRGSETKIYKLGSTFWHGSWLSMANCLLSC